MIDEQQPLDPGVPVGQWHPIEDRPQPGPDPRQSQEPALLPPQQPQGALLGAYGAAARPTHYRIRPGAIGAIQDLLIGPQAVQAPTIGAAIAPGSAEDDPQIRSQVQDWEQKANLVRQDNTLAPRDKQRALMQIGQQLDSLDPGQQYRKWRGARTRRAADLWSQNAQEVPGRPGHFVIFDERGHPTHINTEPKGGTGHERDRVREYHDMFRAMTGRDADGNTVFPEHDQVMDRLRRMEDHIGGQPGRDQFAQDRGLGLNPPANPAILRTSATQAAPEGQPAPSLKQQQQAAREREAWEKRYLEARVKTGKKDEEGTMTLGSHEEAIQLLQDAEQGYLEHQHGKLPEDKDLRARSLEAIKRGDLKEHKHVAALASAKEKGKATTPEEKTAVKEEMRRVVGTEPVKPASPPLAKGIKMSGQEPGTFAGVAPSAELFKGEETPPAPAPSFWKRFLEMTPAGEVGP